MTKHRRIDIIDALAGRRMALERIETQQLLDRTAAEANDIARVVQRTQRAAADVQLLEQSKDAAPRQQPTGQQVLDECQQPGCHAFAGWFVRRRRGATHRPTYRRLCTRDAARRIRRRAHTSTTRRDQAR